eukprot:CAMPEP_0119330230 /NCGR_PEP_ID=MMETSP1333-20130426/77813_1 /TAXON_ID=418940 /ORGANISM="Scyphosphaera apsteinii, Strain RCC1455" /LENGTH=124 /DNA_ID=CAMNT_0007339577 /DNA_START=967 /DNA_END=1341 /DNA_ORIENTATION=+
MTADCAFSGFVRRIFEHTFVASPWGNGHNNHREWEALMGGAIPIVDYDHELESLWHGLPVVQVRSWASITPAYLHSLHAQMQARKFDWAKLYSPFWFGAIWRALKQNKEVMPRVKHSDGTTIIV